MFDRITYKRFARRELKNRWTVPVLVTLLVFAVDALFNLPMTVHFIKAFFENLSGSANFTSLSQTYEESVAYTDSFATLIPSYVGLIAREILYFAMIRLYLKMSETPAPVTFNMFLEGLNMWVRAILVALWIFLWVFLWSLLLFIPGFIKMISYSQTYYLAAEYPHMGIRKAMRISKVMTRGYKGDLFVMYLSFIGWGILACLTCGIGLFWLRPYMSMSFVNAYRALKKQAVDSGILSLSDFC